MKLIFGCFVCVTQRWALHVVIKRKFFFTFIFAVFLPQSIGKILLLPLLKNTAILKFYFRFQFWPFRCHRYVILHWLTKFMQIGWLPTELWRHV